MSEPGVNPDQEFWRWFDEHSKRIAYFESDPEKILNEVLAAIHKVHPELTFQIGPREDNRRLFIVSAGGMKSLFPDVIRLVNSAPKIEGWEIIGFRPRTGTDFSITLQGIHIAPEDIWFKANPAEGKVDLRLYLKNYSQKRRKEIQSAAFILLDAALGEFDTEMKVGRIEFFRLPSDPETKGLLPYARLPMIVDSLTVVN